jgi:hypothetical protein
MIKLGRVALFFVCLWFSVVPFAYVYGHMPELGPGSHTRAAVLTWLFLTNLVPSAIAAVMVCVPIAWAFGRAAPWIALVLTTPFAAIRLYLLRPNAKGLEVGLAWTSIVSYTILVAGATMLALHLIGQRRANGSRGVRTIT